ncbi:hypothetical protein [Verrucosispora sp. TAA-831]|uniref:hypothetical protein n=1 Tax=Verrucosispora sp. TAA-831 TaxID=3422227 RepID=UPI003D6E2039
MWRALTWELTAGRSRFAIPAYYRDEAAQLRSVGREAVRLVRWEYEVDVEQSEWLSADVGFVPARACVPLRPAPGLWQREHAGFAGLFTLASFRHLTDLALAVGGDATSEITLFALHDPGRTRLLASTLNQAHRPDLAEILQPGDIFVGLSVVQDLGAGAASYLTVKTPEATDKVEHLAWHFSEAFRRYANAASQIRTFDEFRSAIDDLLAQPAASEPSDVAPSTARCHAHPAAGPCLGSTSRRLTRSPASRSCSIRDQVVTEALGCHSIPDRA